LPIESIDERLDALAKQPFRVRFHLRGRERALVQLRGMRAIRCHAAERGYVIDVITRWTEREIPGAPQ
jgi:hypothetical protein